MSGNPSPVLAAFLSFIFPGVGQIYAGASRRGLIWALPMLLFIVAVLFLLLGGQSALFGLINAQKLLALLILNIAFFLYHVAAMVDAYDIARRDRTLSYSRRSSGGPVALAALVAVAILLHGSIESYGFAVYGPLVGVIEQGHGDVIPTFVPRTLAPATPTPSPTESPAATPTDEPSGTPSTPSGSPDSTPGTPGTPEPSRTPPPHVDLASWPGWAQDGLLTVLIAGTDSRSDVGVDPNGDTGLRTDSMMLLSIDIASCKAALFSFPRNMNCDVRYPIGSTFPLENGNGQDYPDCLNYLWRSAAAPAPTTSRVRMASGPNARRYLTASGGGGPDRCDTEHVQPADRWRDRGQPQGLRRPGQRAAQQRCLDRRAQAGPAGPAHAVSHPAGPASSMRLLQLAGTTNAGQLRPGLPIPNGEEALAFARSRHQDSDYERARRQQIFLQQVRKQLDPLALFANMGSLITAC